MAKRVGNNGVHGVKGKSGRKPKAFTLLKQRIESEKKEDAEYAFSLYAQTMRDDTQILPLRLSCADWISNRVLGKPNQPNSNLNLDLNELDENELSMLAKGIDVSTVLAIAGARRAGAAPPPTPSQ